MRGGPVRGVLACLAVVVLVVSAGCRGVGGGGASASPSGVDGGTDVCGLAAAERIQDVVGRQIEEFAVTNSGRSSSGLVGFSCWIYLLNPEGPESGGLELNINTTFPSGLFRVPAASRFEEVASSPVAAPVVVESVPGRGVAIPDDDGHAVLVWSYPEGDTVATLRRNHARPIKDPTLFQDVAELEELFAFLGPAALEAANGPAQERTEYPGDPASSNGTTP